MASGPGRRRRERYKPPEWLKVVCLQWGSEMRMIWYAIGPYPDRSSISMLIEGRYLTDVPPSASTQRWPEVFSTVSLAVGHAIKRELVIEEREVLFAHYVIAELEAKEKAERMLLPRSTYYWHLGEGQRKLELALDV